MPTKRNNNNNRRRQNAGRNSRKIRYGGRLFDNNSNEYFSSDTKQVLTFANLDNVTRRVGPITAYSTVAIDHDTCPILMWIPANSTATGTLLKGVSYVTSFGVSPLQKFIRNMYLIYGSNLDNYTNSKGKNISNMSQLVVTDVVVLTPKSIIIGKTHYDYNNQSNNTGTDEANTFKKNVVEANTFKKNVVNFYNVNTLTD